MPFITQINGATINIVADTPVVTLPSTGVLNSFGTSVEFTEYNVLDDADPATTETGEYIAPVIAGSPVPGVYGGGTTIGTADLNVAGLLNLEVNPVSGSYFISNGNVFIITEEALNADNLTVTGTLLGLPVADLSLTELATTVDESALGPLLLPEGVNGLLNDVVTTQTPNPAIDLELDPGEINDLVCFSAGTLILTAQGYIPVEKLKAGDEVFTKDHGHVPISWIGSRKVSSELLAAFPNFRPIRISAGALGEGLPVADLLVSPQHRILIRSKIAQKMFGATEVLVAAKQLLQVDGINVAADVDSVEYVHFMCDEHEVVIANGAETESMFTGPQALKSVGQAARAEIFALFPKLADAAYNPQGARALPSGRMGRKIVSRHLQHRKPLVATIG